MRISDWSSDVCSSDLDRRGEPPTFTGVGVDALVIDPRRLHRHRAGGGDHLVLGVVAIADHQPVPVVVDLTGMPGDLVGDLGMPGRGEHLPVGVAGDLVEHSAAFGAVQPGYVGVVTLVTLPG